MDKELIRKALTRAIAEVNRNLYEWSDGIKAMRMENRIKDDDEVKALVRNWISRETKGIKSFTNLSYSLSKAKLCIQRNTRGQVIGATFNGRWSSVSKEVAEINDVLAQIDYVTYSIVSTIDFSRIKNFSFT